MISGGAGHTTDFLRQAVHEKYPNIVTAGRMEAEIMAEYIERAYGISDFILEKDSTNCGNNVSYALREVITAFQELKIQYADEIRVANPKFKS